MLLQLGLRTTPFFGTDLLYIAPEAHFEIAGKATDLIVNFSVGWRINGGAPGAVARGPLVAPVSADPA